MAVRCDLGTKVVMRDRRLTPSSSIRRRARATHQDIEAWRGEAVGHQATVTFRWRRAVPLSSPLGGSRDGDRRALRAQPYSRPTSGSTLGVASCLRSKQWARGWRRSRSPHGRRLLLADHRDLPRVRHLKNNQGLSTPPRGAAQPPDRAVTALFRGESAIVVTALREICEQAAGGRRVCWATLVRRSPRGPGGSPALGHGADSGAGSLSACHLSAAARLRAGCEGVAEGPKTANGRTWRGRGSCAGWRSGRCWAC